MTSQHYRDPHLDQLHNLRQSQLFVQDYIAIFKDLTHCSDVREHPLGTITRFVLSLRQIKRAMITGPYDLDTIEEAFDVTLRLDLTFKTLVNVKARCSKCKRYEHYNYQCPSESQHVRTVPTDEVDDSKAVKVDQVSSKTINIIEDIAVDSVTQIISEIHMSSDSANDDVDEIIDPNIPTVPSQPFESPYAK